jgi:hypothetical protein
MHFFGFVRIVVVLYERLHLLGRQCPASDVIHDASSLAIFIILVTNPATFADDKATAGAPGIAELIIASDRPAEFTFAGSTAEAVYAIRASFGNRHLDK